MKRDSLFLGTIKTQEFMGNVKTAIIPERLRFNVLAKRLLIVMSIADKKMKSSISIIVMQKILQILIQD